MGLLDYLGTSGQQLARAPGEFMDNWRNWRQGNADAVAGAANAGTDATMKALRGGLLDDTERAALVSTPAWAGDPGNIGGGLLMAGTFAGRGAKTADLVKLAQAEKMAAGGAASEATRAATGWFQGPDQQWRFEIPDNRSKVDLAGKAALGAGSPDMEPRALSDLLQHPALYAAYPDLAETMATARLRPGAPEGSHYRPGGGPETVSAAGARPADVRSAMLHEAQHGIQEREGFALGGGEYHVDKMQHQAEQRLKDLQQQGWSRYWEVGTVDEPGMQALKRQIDEAKAELAHIGGGGFQGYRRLAGEVEARDVQARMNMTGPQRAAQAPYASQGIAPEQMIIRRGLLD